MEKLKKQQQNIGMHRMYVHAGVTRSSFSYIPFSDKKTSPRERETMSNRSQLASVPEASSEPAQNALETPAAPPESARHVPPLTVVVDKKQPKSHSFPIHKVYGIFQSYFRPRRKRAFMQLFPEVAAGASVLDIGGTAGWWKQDFPKEMNISIVNIDDDHRDDVTASGFRFYRTDGRRLPFTDNEFFLAFSNSVIEHVGDLQDQKRFGQEALRCGQKLYLQTPNKWFPVEPHLMTAFIQWLPFKISRRLLRYFSLWGLVAKPSQKQIDEFLLTTRLLTKKELKEIFPGAQIKEEKFLGLTKSFIVIVQ